VGEAYAEFGDRGLGAGAAAKSEKAVKAQKRVYTVICSHMAGLD